MRRTNNPKTAWLQQFITPETVVVTDEDLDWWKENKVQPALLADALQSESVILSEVLQKVENPISIFKNMKRVIIIVPNEYGWSPDYKPFTNANHKRLYDADMLADQLEQAGFTYVLGLIEYSGWSFLCAQATKA